VFAAALPDGRAVALKIADGGDRARPPLMAAMLAEIGVAGPPWNERILGHGKPVGSVQVVNL